MTEIPTVAVYATPVLLLIAYAAGYLQCRRDDSGGGGDE